MSDTAFVVSVLSGTAVALVAYVTLSLFLSEEHRVAKRLRSMTRGEAAQAAEIDPLTMPFRHRAGSAIRNRLTAPMRYLLPSQYARALADRIRLSGPRRRMNPELFVLLKIGLTLLSLILAGVLRAAGTLAPLPWVIVTALAVAVGFFGPNAWLAGRIAARQEAIRRALPDMLDMLTVSVEAGLGFDGSLKKVVSSTRGPLSEEFGVVLQEIQSGLPRSEALQRLAARTGVSELNAFIMAIVQADVFGVSISQVLRTQAHEMRTRRRQRAEELAQKAPAKMVFPLIICILPATLVVVGGPAVISIARFIFGLGL